MWDGTQKRELVAQRSNDEPNMAKYKMYHDSLKATSAQSNFRYKGSNTNPQIDIIKASVRAFTTDSEDDASSLEKWTIPKM